jgi:hypothetical protein
MDVSVFLDPKIDLERLAVVLDGLGHEGRVHAVHGWNGRLMAAIFDAAKGFLPIGLAFLVPDAVGVLTEVIHDGHNSLPAFTSFQKRFTKLEDGTFAGYNHNVGLAALPGPGYFVVKEGSGAHDGELAIDYREVPKAKPHGWPALAPNAGLLGSIVYGGMVDYLRRLSAHVSIGIATRGEASRGQFFVLVRQDAS